MDEEKVVDLELIFFVGAILGFYWGYIQDILGLYWGFEFRV